VRQAREKGRRFRAWALADNASTNFTPVNRSGQKKRPFVEAVPKIFYSLAAYLNKLKSVDIATLIFRWSEYY